MNLSIPQKRALVLFNKGYKCENVLLNEESPFFIKNSIRSSVRLVTLNKLITLGLVYDTKTNWGTQHFHLTELGKQLL